MNKLDELINKLCPNGVCYLPLRNVCRFQNGFAFSSAKFTNEGQKILRITNIINGSINSSDMAYFHPEDYDTNLDSYIVSKGDVVVAMSGATTGKIGYNYSNEKYYLNQRVGLFVPNEKLLMKRYLFHWLTMQSDEILHISSGSGAQPNLSSNKMMDFKIPVPPVEVQCEIVRILDNFTELTADLTADLTAELTARKKQHEYYKKTLLSLEKVNSVEIRKIKLGSIGKVCMCKRIMKDQTSSFGDVPFYKIGTFGKEPDAFISHELFEDYKKKYSYPNKGDVLISCSGTIGRTVIFDGEDAYFQDSNIVWIKNNESIVLNKYLYYLYQLNPFIISTGGTIARLYNDGIERAEVIIPSIKTQKYIISILDQFESLTIDIQSGLPAEIEARQKQYEYYRDKLLSFKELQS